MRFLLWQLRGQVPLLGGWLRRRALRLLADGGSPRGASTLSTALLHARHPQVRAALLGALASLAQDPSREVVARVWHRTRQPELADLLAAWNHLPAGPAPVRVAVALLLRRDGELGWGTQEGAALLAACEDQEPRLRQTACETVMRFREQLTPLVAARWVETRADFLWDLLAGVEWRALSPGPVRVLVGLKQERALESVGPEEVAPLLRAARDADPELAGRAAHALHALLRQDAREALCRRAVEEDDGLALSVALQAGYRPSSPERQAVFLFLTGQFPAYERLDPGRDFLRAACEGASPALRQRIAAVAAREGRTELVDVLAGPRSLPRSAQEWEGVVDVLARLQRYDRLWQLALRAPPGQAARILTLLRQQAPGWRPTSQEAVFAELCNRAEEYDETVFGPTGFCRGVLQKGGDAVECLAVSPDGALLAASLNGGLVRLWSLPSGELMTEWADLAGERSAPLVVFAPRERALFAAEGQVVKVYPLSGGRVRTLHGCTGAVTALALTADGRTLVTLSSDFATVWDLVEDDPEGKPLDFPARLTCQAVSPSGEVLAVGAADGSIWLAWHLPHGELKDALPGHNTPVRDLRFSADGKTLASVSAGGEVRLWDVRRLQAVKVLAGRALPLADPDFLPDLEAPVGQRRRQLVGLWPRAEGHLLAARAAGKVVRLWIPATGERVKNLHGHEAGVTCLASCRPHRVVVSGATDGGVYLWGLPSRGARLATRPVGRMRLGDWHWVRARLGEEGVPEGERRCLRFLDALLRLRWHDAVHVEEASHEARGHDIELEG